MMVGRGNDAVRAEAGYMPMKLCCTESRARGMGVARRYIMSASLIILGMNSN